MKDSTFLGSSTGLFIVAAVVSAIVLEVTKPEFVRQKPDASPLPKPTPEGFYGDLPISHAMVAAYSVAFAAVFVGLYMVVIKSMKKY
jgi:hypothetical protein